MILRLFLFVLPLLALLNLAYLDYVLLIKKDNETMVVGGETKDKSDGEKKIENREMTIVQTGCSQSCVNLVNEATAAALKTAQETIKPGTTTTIVKETAPATTPKEYFIPLGTGSVSEFNKWQDINTAQATFDINSYPNVKATYFEVVMHIPDAQGELRARLVDASTPYIFAGQQLRTISGKGETLSVPVGLQTGQKTYKIQLYTTVAAGVLDLARIRVVTQ